MEQFPVEVRVEPPFKGDHYNLTSLNIHDCEDSESTKAAEDMKEEIGQSIHFFTHFHCNIISLKRV